MHSCTFTQIATPTIQLIKKTIENKPSTYMVKTILCGYVYQVVWEAAVGQVPPHLLGSEAFICSVFECQCLGIFSLYANNNNDRRTNQ